MMMMMMMMHHVPDMMMMMMMMMHHACTLGRDPILNRPSLTVLNPFAPFLHQARLPRPCACPRVTLNGPHRTATAPVHTARGSHLNPMDDTR
jgi:hypothetical protein